MMGGGPRDTVPDDRGDRHHAACPRIVPSSPPPAWHPIARPNHAPGDVGIGRLIVAGFTVDGLVDLKITNHTHAISDNTVLAMAFIERFAPKRVLGRGMGWVQGVL